MSLIKVLLAEDHTIVRKGIRSLLDGEADIEVVAEADNGRAAIERIEEFRPDVVLMDHTMPILNGLEATRQITKRFPEVKVLILTMHTNEAYVFEFLQAGASGYLVKQTAPTELVTAIHAVHQGNSFLSPSISKTVINGFIRHSEAAENEDKYHTLTDREREVLQLLAEGYSVKDVGKQLHISTKTVATHKVHLMDKLNLHSMTDLVKYAIRKGVITLD